MKRYNLSAIMKRAWELVKKTEMSISVCLRKAWAEAKNASENIIETLKKNLEDMAYTNIHINAGVERTIWTRKDRNFEYLYIICRSMAGRHKGTYKCGYIDLDTGEYHNKKYDHVDALNKKWIYG